MTLFFLSAAILVVVSLAWLFVGMKRAVRTTSDQEATNIRIAREKLGTLDEARASGAVDDAAYSLERQQLEHALADELNTTNNQTKVRDGSTAALCIVAVFLPISAGALYLYLGTPEAINHSEQSNVAAASNGQTSGVNSGQSPQQAPDLDELLPKLEARLLETPDDVNGWRLLGRTYLTMSRFDKAVEALDRAVALDNQHPDTIANLAEAIAMQNGGDLSGRSLELVNDALAIDENHQQSMWLQAIGTQQAGDHTTALTLFDNLSAQVAEDPEALAIIADMKLTSEQALGLAAPPVSIKVSVDLSDAAKASVNETDAVFIFARAQSGPPMPLAVSRHTVTEFPLTVTLDESMAMIPNMTLANFTDVVVGARISKSGNAIAEPGDWFAESEVSLGENVVEIMLLINEQK